MKTSQIEKDLNVFHDGMLKAQTVLNTFSGEYDNKLDAIQKELNYLENLTDGLRCEDDSPAARLLNGEINTWSKCLKKYSKAMQNSKKGREFQNHFEKQPLVIVFGIVNSGKSTLGNFLHGRSFRKAAFDNFYKQMPPPEIVVEESGRKDVKHKDAFDENTIESTCSIQYFQVPGFAWVDTPGIGSPEKKKIDLRPLEEIAKQYIRYADLVVFLATSAAPETIESIYSCKELRDNKKKFLIAITKSDMKLKTANMQTRKVERVLIPKTPETRKLQEKSFLESMEKVGVNTKGIETLSISTQLAERAVENQSDTDWTNSNLGILYREIAKVIGNETVLDLKKESPRKMMNSYIQEILGTKKTDSESLTALIYEIKMVRTEMQKRYDQLSPEGKMVADIVNDAVNHLRSKIRALTDDARESKGNSISISLESLQHSVQDAVVKTLTFFISKHVGSFHDIIHQNLSVKDLKATAERKKEIKEYTYETLQKVERDPDGLLEHICSFFGKTYYKYVSRTRKGHRTIDLGIDSGPAKTMLLDALEKRVTEYVKKELDYLRERFFAQALSKMDGLIQKLEKMQNDLKKLQY